MPFLVDGSNLGGLRGGPRGARDAAAVVRWLLSWARTRRQEVIVVFDGPGSPEVAERYGALSVVWSGERSADDRIVERLAAQPDRWTVVTGDRALAARCRTAGAKILPAAELAASLDRPERSARSAAATAPDRSAPDKPPAHAEEREHWRQVFDATATDDGTSDDDR
jgi:predicted RNA-binding protein with PIN domain